MIKLYKKTYMFRALSIVFIILALWLAGWLQTGFRKNAAFLLTEIQVKDPAAQLGELDYLERFNTRIIARTVGASRHFLAAMTHIIAMEDFNNYAWDELAKKYETMVLFSPRNASYWELGSWHISRNAVAYYQRSTENKNQVVSKEQQLQTQTLIFKYRKKGTAFLERGLELLPESALLTDALAKIYADESFDADYLRAAQIYASYIKVNENYPSRFLRSEIYLLAKLRQHRVETYQKSRALILDTNSQEHQVPILQSITYYLQKTDQVQQYLRKNKLEPLSLASIFKQPNIQEQDIQRYYQYLLKKGINFD